MALFSSINSTVRHKKSPIPATIYENFTNSFTKIATFKKDGLVWRVQVAVKGVRTSGTFSTKAEASVWAAMREIEIRTNVKQGPGATKTLQDALDRYAREVSIHKRGHRWEAFRLAAIGRHVLDGVSLGDMRLADITPETIGRWRDHRLQGTPAKGYAGKVTGSTVNRELNILSHVFTTARREWQWIKESPTKDALFRRARIQCQIDNLKFHDSRDEAITRLAKKLNVLELARMVGHRNLSELQTYYNETAEELAKKLQ